MKRSVESVEKTAQWHRGRKRSKETCKKLSEIAKARKLTEETKSKISKATSGSSNPNAKTINIYNEKEELIFECKGNFKETCDEENLPFWALAKTYLNNTKYNPTRRILKKYKHCLGWYARIV